MYVVRHTFEDKYTGRAILAGTIVKLEEGDRKGYLLGNGLVEEAEVVFLPNDDPGAEVDSESEVDRHELTVKEIKAKLDEKGIEYDNRARKDELLKLLETE